MFHGGLTMTNKAKIFSFAAVIGVALGGVILTTGCQRSGGLFVETKVFEKPFVVTSSGISPKPLTDSFYGSVLKIESDFLAAENWKDAESLFTDDSRPILVKMGTVSNFDSVRKDHPPASLTKTIYTAVYVRNLGKEYAFLQNAPYSVPPNTPPHFIVVDCFERANGAWKISKSLEDSNLWKFLTEISPDKLSNSTEEIRKFAADMEKK
jgi:hypothetical protein